MLNNCSLDRICKEGNGYQFGQVNYLRDILNVQGSNVDLIKSRVDRCHGLVAELISICKEAHFGQQQIEMMFLLCLFAKDDIQTDKQRYC